MTPENCDNLRRKDDARMSVVETKVKMWMDQTGEYRKHLDGRLDDITALIKTQNGRIGRLENWRWFITGGLTLIGVLLVAVINVVR